MLKKFRKIKVLGYLGLILLSYMSGAQAITRIAITDQAENGAPIQFMLYGYDQYCTKNFLIERELNPDKSLRVAPDNGDYPFPYYQVAAAQNDHLTGWSNLIPSNVDAALTYTNPRDGDFPNEQGACDL